MMSGGPEKTPIAVVTGGEHKVWAFGEHLPHHHVLWVRPKDLNEHMLVEEVPHLRVRSALVSEKKAEGWGASLDLQGARFALFNDIVQYLPEIDYVLERPREGDYGHWLDQMMIQSGRVIHISAAHTAIRLDADGHQVSKHTVLIEVGLQARLFKKPEVRAFANKVGIDRMMNSAGGLPVQLASDFFDKESPVFINYYPKAFSENFRELHRLPWASVSGAMLLSFATGAYREPLQHVVSSVR